MTNEEAIQELFNLESGKYYDTEYVDEECFRIAIKAICNSDNVKEEIYPLKYDNFKLAQENSDLKKRIESLNNQVDWNLRKSDVEKNELKSEIEQWQSTNLKLSTELTRLECENHQLKMYKGKAQYALSNSVNAQTLIDKLEKEMFSAECYNNDFNGQNVNNLICLGSVVDILEKLCDWSRYNGSSTKRV